MRKGSTGYLTAVCYIKHTGKYYMHMYGTLHQNHGSKWLKPVYTKLTEN